MINIFKNISPNDKEKLLKVLEADTFTFKKNNVILSTIKQQNILCILEIGFIQIIQTDYNGNRIIIEELSDNDVFGTNISSIANSEYDILTKEDTKLIIIDYLRIFTIKNNCNYYHQFIKNLLLIVSSKIKERNERIEILSKRSIRNKLLEYFKITSSKNGSRNIYMPFNFTELADYLAVDRSAMSRELKNLKDEGFIEINKKKITLLY